MATQLGCCYANGTVVRVIARQARVTYLVNQIGNNILNASLRFSETPDLRIARAISSGDRHNTLMHAFYTTSARELLLGVTHSVAVGQRRGSKANRCKAH